MSSNRPDHIVVPSLSAYPYIRLLYENIDCHIPKEPVDWDRVGPHVVKDFDFDYSTQLDPAKIDAALMAPLAAMSDVTFETLCSVLKPRIYSAHINNRDSLANMAQSRYDEFCDEENPVSLDQVMTYLFLTARSSRHVEWARLAELYNESSDDQKEAIHRHFTDGRNRDIGFLFRVKTPEFDLPSGFEKPLKIKDEDGQAQAFDVITGKWLREDFVTNQFEVHAFDLNNRDILIATAPTLELAIARSIKGAINFNGKLYRANLCLHGRFVAQGEIQYTSGSHPHVNDKKPRITWTHVEPSTTPDEGRIEKDHFFKTLYATEAVLGMQWSKVAKLEDELGM
jgi:hypothetical protein